jgi:O-methyltransferase
MKETGRKILKSIGISVSILPERLKRYEMLFEKYKDYTMIPRESFITNLELCGRFAAVPGDYVECGVWRAGMSGAIAEVLGPGKKVHLFDSYQGLPPAKEIDGKAALAWQKDTASPGFYDNCAADKETSIKVMRMAGHSNYEIHEGWFQDTLPKALIDRISILRLDGDWFDSIYSCLEFLYPKVSASGLIIVDDYPAWDGCSRAVHKYLADVNSISRIREEAATVSYIVKRD